MKNKINNGNGGREPHALDQIALIEDKKAWTEKISLWQGPMTFEDRMSWLHVNHVRDGNGSERFVFFLELADRYGEREMFSQLQGHDEHIFTPKSYLSKADLKSRLSKKAFAILCNEFFGEKSSPCPIDGYYKDPLFTCLLWFFRPYGGSGGWDNLHPRDNEGLGNDGGKHYIKVANDFAKNFILDSWQMLNHHWYKCWDCDYPDPELAQPHWREIVVLMRHLVRLDLIERGQYIPTPPIFKKMVRMSFEEHGVKFAEEQLDDITAIGALLEPLVKEGDKLASSLNVARLNVNEYDHGGYKI